jgi:hypothetical protein
LIFKYCSIYCSRKQQSYIAFINKTETYSIIDRHNKRLLFSPATNITLWEMRELTLWYIGFVRLRILRKAVRIRETKHTSVTEGKISTCFGSYVILSQGVQLLEEEVMYNNARLFKIEISKIATFGVHKHHKYYIIKIFNKCRNKWWWHHFCRK